MVQNIFVMSLILMGATASVPQTLPHTKHCGTEAEPPVSGKFDRVHQQQHQQQQQTTSSNQQQQQEHHKEHDPEREPVLWRFNTQTSGCSYALWDREGVSECLKGSWVILVGASHVAQWTVMLANWLVDAALLTKRDQFSLNGLWTQVVDIVLVMSENASDGRVVYRNVVVEPNTFGKEGHKKYWIGHSAKRDARLLPEAFKQASFGRMEERKTGMLEGSYTETGLPKYNGAQIRITFFLAQYWDAVPMALSAVRAASHGWGAARVMTAISLGPWYAGPDSRPEYHKLPFMRRLKQFRTDLAKALPSIRSFCMPGLGRASSCAIVTLAHCPQMTSQFQSLTQRATKEVMHGTTSRWLRLVDLWTLTLKLPDACVAGHQSPMSALWTWQLLMGGFCAHSPRQPILGKVAEFRGARCTAAQANQFCFKKLAQWPYMFDCAMAVPCTLVIHPDPAVMQLNNNKIITDISNLPVTLSLGAASNANTNEGFLLGRAFHDRRILACISLLIAAASTGGWLGYLRRRMGRPTVRLHSSHGLPNEFANLFVDTVT